jgi:hypothetical protein
VAANIIPFPQIGLAPSSLRHASAQPQTSEALASIATYQHRGLHLLTGAIPSAPTQETSQQRANRIVAQVEHEIELQATRERELYLHGLPRTTAHLRRLPSSLVAEIETPVSIARRLFATLLSFARPA